MSAALNLAVCLTISQLRPMYPSLHLHVPVEHWHVRKSAAVTTVPSHAPLPMQISFTVHVFSH